MKNMVHCPCADWCINEKGKCSKNFLKKFQIETTMDENGYPTYCRKNNGVYNRPNGGTIMTINMLFHTLPNYCNYLIFILMWKQFLALHV